MLSLLVFTTTEVSLSFNAAVLAQDKTPFSLLGFQVFPNPEQDSGPRLSTGDRVSWAYVATGLVWPNGTSRGWKLSDMGDGVKIAILDTGIDLRLPDLRGRVVASKDFTGEGPFDDHGHGTAMATIVAANIDGAGMAGVASKARIYAGKVLNSRGSGTDQWIAEGIDWAVRLRVHIISMSFGAQVPCSRLPLSSASLQRALNARVLLVAAGGNEGPPDFPRMSSVACPATYPGVISISSSGREGQVRFGEEGTIETDLELQTEISTFSSRGPEIRLSSPGRHILTWWHGTPAIISGTSPAAPQVAGLMALMINRYGEHANILSRLAQMGRNEFSGKTSFDAFYGYGLISAPEALTPKGDVNGDLRVDTADLEIMRRSVGCTRHMSCYVPAADQDWDGDVDLNDDSILTRFLGSTRTVEQTSVWDLEPIVFDRTIFGGRDSQMIERYGFSGDPDTLVFDVTYENQGIWGSLFRPTTFLNVTIYSPLTRSSISSDVLNSGPAVFDVVGPWFLQVTLRTYSLVNGELTLAGWKITISSGLGYSHDLSIIVVTLANPPP